jgi:hypothetical protein
MPANVCMYVVISFMNCSNVLHELFVNLFIFISLNTKQFELIVHNIWNL